MCALHCHDLATFLSDSCYFHASQGNTAGALSVLASAVRHSPTATRPRLALAEALIRESIRTASAGADEGTARAAAKTALQAIDLVKARAAEEGEEHLQHAVRLAAIAGKLAPGITVDVPQSDGAGAEEAGASREQNVGSEETSSEGQQKMDAKSLAQRAVRAAPWEMANWRALAMASEGQAA